MLNGSQVSKVVERERCRIIRILLKRNHFKLVMTSERDTREAVTGFVGVLRAMLTIIPLVTGAVLSTVATQHVLPDLSHLSNSKSTAQTISAQSSKRNLIHDTLVAPRCRWPEDAGSQPS